MDEEEIRWESNKFDLQILPLTGSIKKVREKKKLQLLMILT